MQGSNSDCFKGTFQNNNYQKKTKKTLHDNPSTEGVGLLALLQTNVVSLHMMFRSAGEQWVSREIKEKHAAQWQASGTACPQFTGFPILRRDHVIMEDKWDTTQERIPCCWQVSDCLVWLDGRKAL